jgi:TPR repeat protein
MQKILMITLKASILFLLFVNPAWAQLTPEHEEARTKGMIAYNMLKNSTALPFLEIAAKGGNSDSQYYLAEIKRNRLISFSNEVRILYESAAEKGDIYAMMRLASNRCHNIANCPPHIKTPTEWLETARSLATERASQGDAEAMFQLLFITGNYDWLYRAAESGFPRAQVEVEALHGFGDTIVMSVSEMDNIARWHKASAEAGYAISMNRHANLLIARGDRKSAGYWTEKAAEAGHFDATLDYARWTAHMPDRVGYRLDLVKAYGLTLLLADADSGPDRITLSESELMLPKIATKMTPEQIEAGKAYAKEWAKSHPPLSKFPSKYDSANEPINPPLQLRMYPVTLRVTSKADAERPMRLSHAEHGNDLS